jgi:hypothetical protein
MPCRCCGALLVFGKPGRGVVLMQLTISITNDVTHITNAITYAASGNSRHLTVPSQTISGVIMSNELGQAALASTDNSLISTSLMLTNTNVDSVTIDSVLSTSDFPGPDNEVYVTGSGSWLKSPGFPMDLTFYDDPLNEFFGERVQRIPPATSLEVTRLPPSVIPRVHFNIRQV